MVDNSEECWPCFKGRSPTVFCRLSSLRCYPIRFLVFCRVGVQVIDPEYIHSQRVVKTQTLEDPRNMGIRRQLVFRIIFEPKLVAAGAGPSSNSRI